MSEWIILYKLLQDKFINRFLGRNFEMLKNVFAVNN